MAVWREDGGILLMAEGWFDELYGASQHFLDVSWNALVLAYAWAKEWQPLLAGLLVVIAALIVARAILKTSLRSSPQAGSAKNQAKLDLRQGAKSAGANPSGSSPQGASQELVGNLEQLRSLVRSALASFTLTAEKENSPAFFLCQRIAHLRLEQLPPNAAKPAREIHAALLQQLELLRLHLKKDALPAEISESLVLLNTSARNLVAALVPASDQRRQAGSEQR
jgi:hypothetical protein